MKKLVLLILAFCFFAVMAVGCAGADVPEPTPEPVPESTPVPTPEPEVVDDEVVDEGPDVIWEGDVIAPGDGNDFDPDALIPAFLSVSGKIESIENFDGIIYIHIEDTDGNPAVLVISEDTYFPFLESFDVGDTVTGWYPSDGIMIMIWPPQYNIAVLSAGDHPGYNIKVDRFWISDFSSDKWYLSQDEMFMFNIDENTEIILADGQDFSDGDIEGRKIIVIYTVSTRSIPEQATAEKLIVLFEGIMPLT